MASGTGVTKPTHRLDSRGVSTPTGRIRPRAQAGDGGVPRIICSYVSTSGPPMSKARFTSGGRAAQPAR